MINVTPPAELILDSDQPFYPAKRIKQRTWDELKVRLTGNKKQFIDTYGNSLPPYSTSHVKISEEDADIIIENIKEYGLFPQLAYGKGKNGGEDNSMLFQEWLVETFLIKQSSFTESFEDTTQQTQQDEQDEEEQKAEEEVKENLEEAVEVVEEILQESTVEPVKEDAKSELPADILDDLPDNLKGSLAKIINKRTGSNIPVIKNKKSSSVSNNRILSVMTQNLMKIQGQLQAIDVKLSLQNELIRANLSASLVQFEQIQSNDDILGAKLDAILNALKAQEDFAKQELDKAEDRAAEARLEQTRDAASTFGFDDLTAGSAGGLFDDAFRKLSGKIGKRAARKLWKLLPKKLRGLGRLGRKKISRLAPKRIGKKLLQKATTSVGKKATQKAATGVASQGIKGSGKNVLFRALKSPLVQKQLVKKVGKEGAEKIAAKVAGKIIPGISTAYGAIEGIARIAMGDVKGGFLSFGGAIPFAGYAFAAIDILRDIDVDAYTKHIESNLPAPSEENISAFFMDSLGVSADQYETGGYTKPGTAILHGTELILPKGYNPAMEIYSPVAGAMIAASSKFISGAGPAASIVAPTFKQITNNLTNIFDIPPTLAQPTVGGSFAGMTTAIKSVEKKSEDEDKENGEDGVKLTRQEQQILDEANNQTGGFFETLMRFFNITPMHPETDVNSPDASGGEYGGDGKFIQGNSGKSEGIHFHIGPGTSPGVVDTAYNADAREVAFKVVKHFLGKKSIFVGRSEENILESDDDQTIRRKIKTGQEVHDATGSGGGIDLQIGGAYWPGAKVPFPLKTSDMKYRPGGFGVSAMVDGANAFVAHGAYDENGKKAPQPLGELYKDGGLTPGVATTITVGEVGEEIVMKNVVTESIARPHLLAMNEADTNQEVIETYKKYVPEILMYDLDNTMSSDVIIMNMVSEPSSQQPLPNIKIPDYRRNLPDNTLPATKTLMLQALYK